MIVKIQRPINTNDPQPKALVYNEDRSYEVQFPIDADLLEIMGDEYRQYWAVRPTTNGLTAAERFMGQRLVKRMPDQSW